MGNEIIRAGPLLEIARSFRVSLSGVDRATGALTRRQEGLAKKVRPLCLLGGLRGMSDPQERASDFLNYLDVLMGDAPSDSFVEIRYRVRETAMVAQFLARGESGRLENVVANRAPSTDVYVGCAPRSCWRGDKSAIDQVWTLWVECDGAESADAAQRVEPRPALVIASGSGSNVHAYWPLREPLRPREAEIANLRLAKSVGADLACFDATRILRPPGTLNHKHEPPRPVRLMSHTPGVRFAADDVVGHLRQIDTEAVEQRWQPRARRNARSDPLLAISPTVYVRELVGVPPGRDRKVPCPFHHDERPSLHVYAAPERGWSCYSCRRGGSIYDLAAELWGMGTRGREFLELRRRLLDAFAIEVARVERHPFDRATLR
jgi:hypothetical protein